MKKLPIQYRQKVIDKIKRLGDNPFDSSLDVKKFTNTSHGYRLRIGNIRLIYQVYQEHKQIYIQEIGFRGQIY